MFLLQIHPNSISDMSIYFHQSGGCRVPHRGRWVAVQGHYVMQEPTHNETLSTIPEKTSQNMLVKT